MSRLTPKIALSVAFLFVLPVVGGQLQGYSVAHPQTSGQTVVFKSSTWPPVQRISAIQLQSERG